MYQISAVLDDQLDQYEGGVPLVPHVENGYLILSELGDGMELSDVVAWTSRPVDTICGRGHGRIYGVPLYAPGDQYGSQVGAAVYFDPGKRRLTLLDTPGMLIAGAVAACPLAFPLVEADRQDRRRRDITAEWTILNDWSKRKDGAEAMVFNARSTGVVRVCGVGQHDVLTSLDPGISARFGFRSDTWAEVNAPVRVATVDLLSPFKQLAAASATVSRKELIEAAATDLIDEDDAANFTKGGKLTTIALEARLGFDISAQERDEACDAVELKR